MVAKYAPGGCQVVAYWFKSKEPKGMVPAKMKTKTFFLFQNTKDGIFKNVAYQITLAPN